MEKLKDADETLRDKIMAACKNVRHQRHSTTYILSQVRKLGFADDVTEEVLTDIIASLQ